MKSSCDRVMRRIAIFALVLVTLPAWAATLTGRVVYVSDGDSVTVLDASRTQHKVRLAGIDAPEKGQAFGRRAGEYLALLVKGKEVTVTWEKIDRYQRKVGKVMVTPPDCPTCAHTLDANLAMVTVGLAWHYKAYAKEQSAEDRERYDFAEREARARRAGLWHDQDPTPPWEWRKAKPRK